MAVYSTQWRSPKLYNFFSRENRGRMFANMGQNINIDVSCPSIGIENIDINIAIFKCLKRMWNFSEYRMIRMFFSYSANVTTENIYVPKQHRWTIDRDEPKVHDNNVVAANETTGKGKQVRCLLFKSSQRNNNHQSILFYIHGGGFISQTPETHESYLRDWATQLKGKQLCKYPQTRLIFFFLRYSNSVHRLHLKSRGSFPGGPARSLGLLPLADKW